MANVSFVVTLDIDAIKAFPVAKNATYPVKQFLGALEDGFRNAQMLPSEVPIDEATGRPDADYLKKFEEGRIYTGDFIHDRATKNSHSNPAKKSAADLEKDRLYREGILAVISETLGCDKPHTSTVIADAMTDRNYSMEIRETVKASALTSRLKSLVEEGYCDMTTFREAVKAGYEYTEKETPSDKGAKAYHFHVERFIK